MEILILVVGCGLINVVAFWACTKVIAVGHRR